MRDDAQFGPVVVHSAGAISYVNDEFCTLVGADSPTELVGDSLRTFVSEDDWEALSSQFDEIGSDVPVLGLKLELARPDGDGREVIAVSSRVDWEEVTQIQTSCIDISADEGTAEPSLKDSAMDEAPIGITIADATREDEPLIYVNQGFVELTGHPREEIIGQNCRFLQGEATREEPVRQLREAIDAEEPVTVELRNYRKDGSMFWNRVTVSPVRNEDGTVTHFLGFQEDISAEKIYKHEKTLFEAHAEASSQVMFLTDREGVIEYVNPAFERVTGYSAEEAIGEDPSILKSNRHDDEFYEDLWNTIEAGETWEATLTNRTKSGEYYQTKQTILPITDDRGDITNFAAIEQDITEEQLTSQVLDVLNRVLRHNVRTSINVIDGYTDLLAGDLDEAEQKTAIRTIRDRTTALEKISQQTSAIRNLLDGHEDPSPLPLASIEDIVAQLRDVHANAEITLSIDVDGDGTIKNGAIFQVALETAIENAIEHNDAETPRIEVTVSRSADGGEAIAEIVDKGSGIPETEWEVIKTGRETPLQHTNGIGLWLLYWSVTALGGTVSLSESGPTGSRITVEVPLIREPDEVAPEG